MRLFLILLSLVCFMLTYSVANAQELTQKKYEPATVENFSRLYWALDTLDLANDTHIKNYMMINECEVYKEYVYNEFQWGSIQQYARDYLAANKDKFPVRFEFIQALRLGNYDFERQGFTFLDKYEMNGVRRFEIEAIDIKRDTCGQRYTLPIEGYPKAILMELSRPVTLDFLPMSLDQANEYINEKTIEFKKADPNFRKLDGVYNFRDIYIVFNVRFFASGGTYYSDKQRANIPKLLGVLEEINIYDDIERTKLLFNQDFKRKRVKKKEADEAASASNSDFSASVDTISPVSAAQ